MQYLQVAFNAALLLNMVVVMVNMVVVMVNMVDWWWLWSDLRQISGPHQIAADEFDVCFFMPLGKLLRLFTALTISNKINQT